MEKKINVRFAPGCFDGFEGTQEELESLLKEIATMFQNITPEELEANAVELSDEDAEQLGILENFESRTLH